MEPYKAKKLPFSYELNSDLLKLLNQAYESYGEYKGNLKTMQYDYKCFIENSLINDLYYSFKIDGSKMKKEDMFHFSYSSIDNDIIEFNNMKRALLLGITDASKNSISLNTLNSINKTLYLNCKKETYTKGSGKLRKKQTYILKPGLAGSSVSFVPPIPSDLPDLMRNLIDYINTNQDQFLISTIMTHYQYEKIHPYIASNGKIGRLLMPIQFSMYKHEPPILYISESIDNLKNTYFTLLSNDHNEEINEFIKFMLQCIIEQCNINIKRIKKLNKIYTKDLEEFKEKIGGSTIYKMYPVMLKKVVFTTNDLVEECGLHINSVSKVLNKLVDCGYLIKEKKPFANRVTFTYKNILDVFLK